jgi:hypothetical protein
MFKMTLGPSGYEWTCTHGGCAGSGMGTNAAETALAAVRHRDDEHPEAIHSVSRVEALNEVVSWLNENGLGDIPISPISMIQLVNSIARTLGHVHDKDEPVPGLTEMAKWGKNPMTMDTMHDPRLIELPRYDGPTRNWSTNHQVRWAVGDVIDMPPEGKGCKAYGARVGEDSELCSLPLHNAANIKHVFAIGGRVTRIAHH